MIEQENWDEISVLAAEMRDMQEQDITEVYKRIEGKIVKEIKGLLK